MDTTTAVNEPVVARLDPKRKILFVDDDANLLSAIQRALRRQFRIDIATGGAAGMRELASQEPYAVVVADMQMPEMNGIDFLKQVEARHPDTIRVMLTGNADQKTAVEAVNQGHVFRFLNKPCAPGPLAGALRAALRQHQLVLAEKEILENTLNGAVKILTEVLSTLDAPAFGRGERLRDAMRAFTRVYPVRNAWELELAAMLAAIGRVTVPATVLLKERSGLPLTAPEKELLQSVPEIGARLLERIPRLENVAHIVRYQAKNFDGTGLPSEPAQGEQIPVGARVLRVLIDLYELEARGMGRSAAFERIQEQRAAYDPAVVQAACQCFDIAPTPANSASRAIRLDDLEPGQTLAKDLRAADGLFLEAGSRLTPLLVERLRNLRQLDKIAESVRICA